jgi:S-DNA-T family DNA segregation ATPase FtsK/SpoIIIE
MARARSRARGRDIQQPSIVPLGLLGVVTLGAAATAFRLPGFVLAWLGLIVIAYIEPPAILTGPKDKSGYPAPANPGEQRRLTRYQLWREMRVRLLTPIPLPPWDQSGLLPGNPIAFSFLAACLAAGFAAAVPSLLPAYMVWLKAGNALTAFLAVGQSAAAMRKVKGSPGTRLDSLPATWRSRRRSRLIAASCAGTVLAAGYCYALLTQVPTWWGSWLELLLLAFFGAPLIFLLTIYKPWSDEALEHWRLVQAADAEWRPRWETMKQPVIPQLTDRQQVGAATVDTFDIPQGYGSAGFLALTREISPRVGAGQRVAVLSVPDEDSTGPRPGTIHPNRFQVVIWPIADIPDLTDPQIDDDAAALLAHCCMFWSTDSNSCARMVPVEITRITEPGSQASAFSSRWHSPEGLTIDTLRTHVGAGPISELFSCEVLLDPVASVVYFGSLTADIASYTDPSVVETLAHLAEDDVWDERWAGAGNASIKANPPVPQHTTSSEKPLPNGVVVHKLAFVCRMGQRPEEFFGLENALGNTSLGAAPFVAITGYPAQSDRPGERHPQAFTLYWSDGRPPNLDRLGPSGASSWVLAGRINQAFKEARLAGRPEVVTAKALTTPESPLHIWEVRLRHYAGVTMGDVRSKTERLRQAMGIPWLRVDETDDGSILFLGAEPDSQVRLVSPGRDLPRLKALDWTQAFLDASCTGSGNTVPQLVEFNTMPSNQSVEVLVFTLPAGLDLTLVKEKVGKFKAATGNTYVEVRPSTRGADHFTIVTCETNPMPEMVPYDFEHPIVPGEVPFATGIDGEPIVWARTDAPHLLFAGTSGSGKSAGAQNILYGAAVSGCELVIIDPTKGAADFGFLLPYARRIVGLDAEQDLAFHIIDAAATMMAVYDEGLRRRRLNATHRVGSYLELPDEVRPRTMIVFIDEFVGLIGQDKVPSRPFEDEEMEHERQIQLMTNIAKTRVGQLSSKIAAEARAWGIHLILGTQKLPAAMLDSIPNGSILKVNLARILLGKTTSGDRMSALRVPEEIPPMGDSIGKGRGVWEPLESSSVLIQTWYATQAKYADQLQQRIAALEQEELLDTTVHRSKMRLPEKPTGPWSGQDDDDRVIDLGELEFTFGDEVVGEETPPAGSAMADGTEGPAQPRPVVSLDGAVGEEQSSAGSAMDGDAEGPAQSRPVVFLDVDGVLVPAGDGSAWADRQQFDLPGARSVSRSAQQAEEIAALGDTVWLTSWGEDAPLFFPEMAEAPVLTEATGPYWGKTNAVLDYLDQHPDAREVIWMDRHLDEEEQAPHTRAALVTKLLDRRNVRCLLIRPDPQVGVTPEDLARAREWCSDPAGGSVTLIGRLEADQQAPAPSGQADGAETRRRKPPPVLVDF